MKKTLKQIVKEANAKLKENEKGYACMCGYLGKPIPSPYEKFGCYPECPICGCV